MWPFSSDGSEAGSSSTQAGPSTPLIPSTPVTTAAPGQDPTAETPTSQPNAASTRDDTPKSRWSRTIEDELSYQARIYPTTEELPSCMSIMDDFFKCYALGPQLRNFYRHGTIRDCTWKWADFKYCLSLKSEDMEQRRELWVKRRAEWWAQRRVGASSEDVWNLREKPLENFPPLYADDEYGVPPTETPM